MRQLKQEGRVSNSYEILIPFLYLKNFFFLLGASVYWVMPTSIREGHMLCSVH